MRITHLAVLALSVATLTGCAMFYSWKSIPPPGGCDQCHSVPISNNWVVSYRAATLTDERGRVSFQTPEANMPTGTMPTSSLEVKKEQDLPCFECHKTPSPAHKGRTGRFHH